MRRRIAALMLAAAMALTLPGCGSGTSPASGPSESEAGSMVEEVESTDSSKTDTSGSESVADKKNYMNLKGSSHGQTATG
ncbi:MAG: hypothetical protein IKF22_11295 [Lachnospiraceae bacterium]|nr:hypothetical protein [Lachnospiraceae bacterium]